MASGHDYYYHGQQQHYQRQYQEAGPPLPLHLCFFLFILFVFLTLSWYLSYESALESLVDQLKLVLVLSPLVLLLAVHWLSSAEPGRLPLLLPLPERDSLHRAGGSPWGVGLVLVLLMVMVSYQSSFHERWFPLLSR
ncbi:hypothetical protein Taro_004437 [Colocasia esculenta]|uniref:Uncharacterized protein n=1 Tax=Colocasia esculenta TaxID=4460 RepID=A0A843TRN8_COLES|nr:hypothetical protein [Colocasia esculenta]